MAPCREIQVDDKQLAVRPWRVVDRLQRCSGIWTWYYAMRKDVRTKRANNNGRLSKEMGRNKSGRGRSGPQAGLEFSV